MEALGSEQYKTGKIQYEGTENANQQCGRVRLTFWRCKENPQVTSAEIQDTETKVAWMFQDA